MASNRLACCVTLDRRSRKEGDDRLEEKVDLIVQALDKDSNQSAKIDRAYLGD
jgi:hypothetical protein